MRLVKTCSYVVRLVSQPDLAKFSQGTCCIHLDGRVREGCTDLWGGASRQQDDDGSSNKAKYLKNIEIGSLGLTIACYLFLERDFLLESKDSWLTWTLGFCPGLLY